MALRFNAFTDFYSKPVCGQNDEVEFWGKKTLFGERKGAKIRFF